MKPTGGEDGTMLAEVLIASTIIAVGLLALLSTISISAYSIQEGQQLTTATFLANQRLEQVKASQWTVEPSVDALGVSATGSAPPKSGGLTTFPDEAPMPAPYAGFSRTVRVTECSSGSGCAGVVGADLRQVTVSVSYRPLTGIGQAPAGTTKAAVVSTLVARK